MDRFLGFAYSSFLMHPGAWLVATLLGHLKGFQKTPTRLRYCNSLRFLAWFVLSDISLKATGFVMSPCKPFAAEPKSQCVRINSLSDMSTWMAWLYHVSCSRLTHHPVYQSYSTVDTSLMPKLDLDLWNLHNLVAVSHHRYWYQPPCNVEMKTTVSSFSMIVSIIPLQSEYCGVKS